MKKKVAVMAVMVALIAAGWLIWGVVQSDQSHFVGSRVKNADLYRLEFRSMNQVDTHTMSLKQGDRLAVHLDIEKGRVDVQIGIEGKPPIYTGNDVQSFDFEVGIAEDGDHVITVSGQKAAGTVEFSLKD